MKLKIEEDENIQETEIIIRCATINDKIKRVSDMISTYYINLLGKKDNENYVLSLDDIYYFEAVENHVFAYVAKDVYEVGYKLSELVETLEDTSFIQVARTIILNINKIQKVSTLVNGRIMAVLDNHEKMVITRVYAHHFKRKLKG